MGVHGLFIKNGFYQGLLLPQVATEYNWDEKNSLSIPARKPACQGNVTKQKAVRSLFSLPQCLAKRIFSKYMPANTFDFYNLRVPVPVLPVSDLSGVESVPFTESLD